MKDRYKKLFEQYEQEATEELKECGLEWDDNFIIPHDYSPNFDYGEEEHHLRFNVIIGQMMLLMDLINDRI